MGFEVSIAHLNLVKTYRLPVVISEGEAVTRVVDVDVGPAALVDLAVDELGGAALHLACREVGQRFVGLQVVAVLISRCKFRADAALDGGRELILHTMLLISPLMLLISNYPVSTDGQRHAVGRNLLGGDSRNQDHERRNEFHHVASLGKDQVAIAKFSNSVQILSIREITGGRD